MADLTAVEERKEVRKKEEMGGQEGQKDRGCQGRMSESLTAERSASWETPDGLLILHGENR